MAKAPDAFRTISEVAELLDTPAHVLRFWESKFAQVKPVKRAGGRRYYRPDDVALLGGIKVLLHDQGMTIKGAQKVLRDRGVKAVADMGRPPEGDVIDAVALAPAPVTHPPATDEDVMTQGPVDDTPQEDPPQDDLPQDDAITRVSDESDEVPAQIDIPPVEAEEPTAAVDASSENMAKPNADETPAVASPRKLAITDISFVDDDASESDNVVPLPRQAPSPTPGTAEISAETATPPPDLPDLPRPRPITGSRLLGTLARMDRALVIGRTGDLAPILDRLTQAHDRLTGH